jgi:hypothetical protein
MLDPAGLGIDLLMLLLRDGDDRTLSIEHDEASAGRSLVDGADVLAHGASIKGQPRGIHGLTATTPAVTLGRPPPGRGI